MSNNYLAMCKSQAIARYYSRARAKAVPTRNSGVRNSNTNNTIAPICSLASNFTSLSAIMPTGVLTASNASYWPTLSALALACKEQDFPLAVADHGLQPEQRNELLQLGHVTMLDNTLDINLYAAAKQNTVLRATSSSEAWLKPWICKYSPFNNTVWIDADAIPVFNLKHLFDLTAVHGSWVTRNHWSGNNPRSYKNLAQAIGGVDLDRYNVACHINSGVFGYTRDTPWIDVWRETILKMFMLDIASTSSTRDQAALVMALSSTDTPMPPLLWLDKYNLAANYLPAMQRHDRKNYNGLSGAQLLNATRADHPDAFVVHWMGRPKPWDVR